MKFRSLAMIALAFMAAFVAVGLPATSGATFTASTTNTVTINAASDWTPPSVSLQNPGSTVKDTVTLGQGPPWQVCLAAFRARHAGTQSGTCSGHHEVPSFWWNQSAASLMLPHWWSL